MLKTNNKKWVDSHPFNTIPTMVHIPSCRLDDQFLLGWNSLYEKTIACPICKEPYVIYAHKSDQDQSVCPACRRKAKENV